MKGMMKVKLVIALLVVIAVAIFYYVSLPAINIHATETWKFIFLILAVLFVLYIVRKAKIAGQSNATQIIQCAKMPTTATKCHTG